MNATRANVVNDVFIAPYRNWNMAATGECGQSDAVFIAPYRNWNVDIVALMEKIEIVFIAPYRNWNEEKDEAVQFDERVFIAPNRNWNEKGEVELKKLKYGLYSTISELKQIWLPNQPYFY